VKSPPGSTPHPSAIFPPPLTRPPRQVQRFLRPLPYRATPSKTEAPPGTTCAGVTTLPSVPHGRSTACDHHEYLDALCTIVKTDLTCRISQPGAEILHQSSPSPDVPATRLHRSALRCGRRSAHEQRSRWISREGPFDLINSVGVLHHRASQAPTVCLAARSSQLGATPFSLQSRSLESNPHPAALQDLCVADRSDARLAGKLFQNCQERTTACAAITSKRPRHRQRMQNCRHVPPSQRRMLTLDGVSFVEASG